MDFRDPEDDELARRLEAYAEARLSPELSTTTRMRAHVMAVAHRQGALAHADAGRATSTALVARPAADRTRRSAWRRPMTALLAAGLTLGVGVGSVAAAQPGGPLYGARIWTERLTLPSGANERAQAELRRLEDRLAEAAAASAAGNTNATNAALDAYGDIVREATDDASGDAAASATLDVGVRHNIEVLTVLVGRVPEQARDAIQHAIDRSDSALDNIHEPNGGPPATAPTKSPRPNTTDRTPNPNKPTPDPADPTPKPHPTPKPQPTPKAEATPKPDHTPRGGPPWEPTGNGNGVNQDGSQGD